MKWKRTSECRSVSETGHTVLAVFAGAHTTTYSAWSPWGRLLGTVYTPEDAAQLCEDDHLENSH